MNARAYFLLAVLASVLGGGCVTNGMADHVIEIRAAQREGEPPGYAGLSASVATNLFYDVASRLGSLGFSNPPHHYNLPDPARVEYAVQFTPEDSSSVDVTMDMDGKHIIFRGETDADDRASIAALQKAMKLYQESLDERHIVYQVRTFTTHLYLIPS